MSSTEPVRVFSGFTVAQVALNAVTATLVYDNAGANAAEQDPGKYTVPGFREFKNLDAAITVYIGPDNTVTTTTGHRIDPGQTFTLAGTGRVYVGPIYAIAASGTPSVSKAQY